jgi:hypothetical protein
MIYFDIETEALPEAEIAHLMPTFEAPSNYKDPEKIAANIADQKAKWLERAALSPLTGRVMAIGLKGTINDLGLEIHEGDEEAILLNFGSLLFNEFNFYITQPRLKGWNIRGFDIPFLITRGWKYEIKFPKWMTEKAAFGQPPFVEDLMDTFKAGDYRAPYVSLDTAARFLGLEGKLGSGKDFASLYHSDKAAALAYLRRDVELLEEIDRRINA